MRWLSTMAYSVRSLFAKKQLDEQLSEEIQAHVEMATAANVDKGMTPEEARYAALREFGNVASFQQQAREARGWTWFEQGMKSCMVAGRRLRRSPGFALTVIAILGLCLGGNLTIFAWVDSILLRSLPFPEADRLVLIYNTYPQAGVMRDGSSVANYYERRGQLPAFSAVALYQPGPAMVGEPTDMRREATMRVSPEFFTTLGRSPVLGRSFNEAETDSWQAGRVTILSDAYWRQHFNADPQVIGRQVPVNGMPHTIVGVLPPDFHFLSFEPRLYFPLVSLPGDRASANRHSGGNVTQMIARLSSGVNLEAAQVQIDTRNAALAKDDPEAEAMRAAGFRSLVVSLHDDHVAGIRPTLWLMQAGGLFLLLIGATNLVNLLLLRASERRKDLAIRQALGASRGNMVTEVMIEIMLLTLSGGVLGLAAGAAGIKLSATLGADRLPLGAHVILDARLAWLTASAVVALGVLVGLTVAALVLRTDPRDALQAASHGATTSRTMRRMRHGFVVVQLTLAFVLLVAASQLVLSFRKSLAVSPGFAPANVLSEKMWISPASASSPSDFVSVTERVLVAVARQPGVAAVGLITNIPFGGLNGKGAATVKDWTLPAGESPRGHYIYSVSGDYFTALNLDLRAGRFLTADDSRRPERVCVVDEDFARYYWPMGSALGHVVFEGAQTKPDAEGFVVVGVVGRVKQVSLIDRETPGAVYFPFGHRPDRDVYIVVRAGQSSGFAGEILPSLAKQIHPTLTFSEPRMMSDRLDDSLITQRSPAMLAGLFAGVALLLAAVGTFGLLSYAVTQQYREIAIRIALGARPEQIRRQFLAQSGRLLFWSAIFGTIGTWLAGRAVVAILYEVPGFSVPLWAGTLIFTVVVTLLAAIFPAIRAAKVDPLTALRAE